MNTPARFLILIAIAAALSSALIVVAGSPPPVSARQAVLADGVDLPAAAGKDEQQLIRSLLTTAQRAGDLGAVTVDYPLDGSVVPPEIVAPTFLWHDAADKADRWLIHVAFTGGGHIYALSDGPSPQQGEVDEKCISQTNEIYKPTEYQASARSWTPGEKVWGVIKSHSVDTPATVTIMGFGRDDPAKVLSRGAMTLTTSSDPVGAPVFYRDVPLMPVKSTDGVIRPLPEASLPIIAWRLKDISRPESRVVIQDMPTCGNCHSFSADGSTLAMDIDGPGGDKGNYAIVPITKKTAVRSEHVMTWNSFTGKPKDHKTIGFMSQISPDGKHVISTVNEEIYVVNFTDHHFLQVFYPTRGILAVYSNRTKQITALPGADSLDYVQCDPVWTPDGKSIIFARAKARDAQVANSKAPLHANHPDERQIQYDLVRLPFNEGRGGTPELIKGASANGVSNTFPKVSPDGKWIVFVKCRNGQLMRPDSELWIVPTEGGEARRMTCNTNRMNSWHSFSPNGRWLVFSSKSNTPYTQMFLTHIDEAGNDSLAILIPNATVANRAVNIPEFVNIAYDDLQVIDTPVVEHYRHINRGDDLTKQNKYAEALDAYRKAIEIEPTSGRVHHRIASCLKEMGQPDQAIDHLRKALAIDPIDHEAMFALGVILLEKGQLPQAIRLFTRVIEIQPGAKVHVNQGIALASSGRPREAVRHLRQALRIDPSYADAHFNLAVALAGQGRAQEAIKHLKAYVEIKPADPMARVQLGALLQQQGAAGDAAAQFKKAIELDPKCTEAYNQWGIALVGQNRLDDAIAMFRKALRIDPNHAGARSNLRRAQQLKAQGN